MRLRRRSRVGLNLGHCFLRNPRMFLRHRLALPIALPLVVTTLFPAVSFANPTQDAATPVVSAPAPEIFAPGEISGPANDGAPTFSPDGNTLFFTRHSAVDRDRRVAQGQRSLVTPGRCAVLRRVARLLSGDVPRWLLHRLSVDAAKGSADRCDSIEARRANSGDCVESLACRSRTSALTIRNTNFSVSSS
jgi:hypothetical protein